MKIFSIWSLAALIAIPSVLGTGCEGSVSTGGGNPGIFGGVIQPPDVGPLDAGASQLDATVRSDAALDTDAGPDLDASAAD